MILEYPNLKGLFPVGRNKMTPEDFAYQIDKAYAGLGIPTLYGVLSILANKSVFFIGERGTGKTRIIKSVPELENTYVSKWDTFTYSELSNYCSNIPTVNNHLVFKVEELATFSKYHKELFLTVCSKIISEGSFEHLTKHSPNLSIKNCKLTMLIAIQPLIYNQLCTKYTAWEALTSDRFTKFVIINPLREETIDVDLVPTLPRKISNRVSYNKNNLNLTKLVEVFKGHVSEGRANLYARDYAIAMAKFMSDGFVEQKHINAFFDLFSPYLNAFSVLQKAENMDSPVVVTTGNLRLLGEIGKYMDFVSKAKLAKDLHVDERSVERAAKELVEVGLIGKPSNHAGKYRLSEWLIDYFRKYKENIT